MLIFNYFYQLSHEQLRKRDSAQAEAARELAQMSLEKQKVQDQLSATKVRSTRGRAHSTIVGETGAVCSQFFRKRIHIIDGRFWKLLLDLVL